MLSIAAGSTTTALLEETIGQNLDATAVRFPDREALIVVHQGIRQTWAEFNATVDDVAKGLMAIGVDVGDRVGMWASSCVEWVLLQVATARIGAVLVNVNPAYRTHDLRYILERSRMKAIFLYEKDSRADYVKILGEAREIGRAHV